MNSKLIWLSIIAIIISFFGGFYLANSLNGNELAQLRAENERMKKSPVGNTSTDSDDSLSDEEIRQKIAEADKNPANIPFQRNLGLALLSYGVMKQNEGLISESARLLQRAYDSDPKDFDVTVALGTAHYDIASLKNDGESFKKSREFYAKALEQKPDNASVRADFGSTFVFVNPPDFERANSELQKALQTEPKNERALLLMTQMLVKQNKPAEAEKFLARLKEVNPKAPTLEQLTAQMAQDNGTIQK
jgi:tetratricopeptide (TPR) repeat protein